MPWGQGDMVEDAKADLLAAVELNLQDRAEDIPVGLPRHVIREPLLIGWSPHFLTAVRNWGEGGGDPDPRRFA